MKRAKIIFKKQVKDTFRNKEILIQFLLMPVMTLIMENAVKIDGMPEHFFATLFSSMYIGMAPLTCAASIIAQERETGTLRSLMMSGVRAWEYLAGVSGYVWILCMAGALVMGAATCYRGADFILYMIAMGVGFAISCTIGAGIGMAAPNQMAATSIAMPVMMIFSFLPMLGSFNESILEAAKCTYTQQIYAFMGSFDAGSVKLSQVMVVLINLLLGFAYFIYAYKKGLGRHESVNRHKR